MCIYIQNTKHVPCSMRDFMTEYFNVSPASSQDHSEPMRTITCSRATHNRLYVCTLDHHYDQILKRTWCSAPFVLHNTKAALDNTSWSHQHSNKSAKRCFWREVWIYRQCCIDRYRLHPAAYYRSQFHRAAWCGYRFRRVCRLIARVAIWVKLRWHGIST